MYVLDTNVLSHTSPLQRAPNRQLITWLERNGDHLYLSSVTITEVAYGVAWLRHRGARQRAALLDAWVRDVMLFHSDRILTVDVEAVSLAGALLARARAAGSEVDIEDAWIAATAELRGMTVLTANERHFRPMGGRFLNPFEAIPPDITPEKSG